MNEYVFKYFKWLDMAAKTEGLAVSLCHTSMISKMVL